MALRTVAEVSDLLDGLGLPNTNLKWRGASPPPLPYAVLVPHESRHQYADGGVFSEAFAYDVELYTQEFDGRLNGAVSSALRDAGIAFSRDTFADEENQYCVTYFSMTLAE